MATPNEIVGFLKDSLGTLRQVLEELDKRVDSISLNKETEENEEFNKTKQLIDDLFEKSSNFKSKFYQQCKMSKEKDDLHSKSNFTKITDVNESDPVNEELTLIASSEDSAILSNEAVTTEINPSDTNNEAKSNPVEHSSSKKKKNDVNNEKVENKDKEKKNAEVENRDKEKKKNTEVNIEEVENREKEKNEPRKDKIKLGLNKSILASNKELDQSSDCNDTSVKIKDKEDNSKNNVITKKKNDNQKLDKDVASKNEINKTKEKETFNVGETEKIGISSGMYIAVNV